MTSLPGSYIPKKARKHFDPDGWVVVDNRTDCSLTLHWRGKGQCPRATSSFKNFVTFLPGNPPVETQNFNHKCRDCFGENNPSIFPVEWKAVLDDVPGFPIEIHDSEPALAVEDAYQLPPTDLAPGSPVPSTADGDPTAVSLTQDIEALFDGINASVEMALSRSPTDAAAQAYIDECVNFVVRTS